MKKTEGQLLQKELADHLREKDLAALRLLRAQINAARVNRKGLLATARTQCRDALMTLRARQARERSSLVERHQLERLDGKTACETGKTTAKREGRTLELDAKETLRRERIERQRIRDAGKAVARRSTHRERSAEDDDAVRSNLPPELVSVFEKVRRTIKAGPRRSRTEAFLEWAAENPDEVIAVQSAVAEKDLKQMMKTHREFGRDVRSARRYKLPPDELKALLAGVPF